MKPLGNNVPPDFNLLSQRIDFTERWLIAGRACRDSSRRADRTKGVRMDDFVAADIAIRPSGAVFVTSKNASGGGVLPESPSREADQRLGAADLANAAEPVKKRRGPKKHELTKTQERLLREIAAETVISGGLSCTKRALAERLGRSVKTIDRLIADLRARGYIDVEMRFDERGGQVASTYRATSLPRAPR